MVVADAAAAEARMVAAVASATAGSKRRVTLHQR